MHNDCSFSADSSAFAHSAADGGVALAYRRARRKVRRLRGWYIHLVAYLAVNAFLWGRFFYAPPLNWAQHDGVWPWPLHISLFWGLGLCLHGLLTWSKISGWGGGWEARKIEEFVQRERR